MKKKTIFYIWGYGSSPESQTLLDLKELLSNKKYNVCSDYYAQYNPEEALFDLTNLINESKPDLIIGVGLGGYLALQLQGYKKILIDPYLNPVDELEKLTEEIENKDGEITEYDRFMQEKMKNPILKWAKEEFPLWLSGLRIRRCCGHGIGIK